MRKVVAVVMLMYSPGITELMGSEFSWALREKGGDLFPAMTWPSFIMTLNE